MSNILELIEESRKEDDLNNKKAFHNRFATLDEMQPYENIALSNLIDAVDQLF